MFDRDRFPLPGDSVDPERIKKIAQEQQGQPGQLFSGRLIVGLTTCSACGENHDPMWFDPLVPPETIKGQVYTHVAICPNTDMAVYLRVDSATKAGG